MPLWIICLVAVLSFWSLLTGLFFSHSLLQNLLERLLARVAGKNWRLSAWIQRHYFDAKVNAGNEQ